MSDSPTRIVTQRSHDSWRRQRLRRGAARRTRRPSALLALATVVLALSLGGVAAAQTVATPFVVTGTVTTAAGEPLAGVEMFADNTLFYNSNILGYTDAEGRYRIELPGDVPGTWNVGGYVRTTFHGVRFDLRLHPLLDQAVVASEGGIRDFEWRLTGPVPEGDYFYGEDVWVYEYDFAGELWIDDVELTFTPLEPLIDGSIIEPFTRRPVGSMIADVPLGFYRVSARYVPDGEPPRDLVITVRFDDAPSTSVDAAFTDSTSYGTVMELEVGMP